MALIELRVRILWSVLFFFLLLSQKASADLSYIDLKGVDEIVGNQPALNPAYGFLQLSTALPNRRFYGNYGPKKEGLGCLEHSSRIHAILIQNKDCPQDASSEWLQRLFPSQDGIHFVANQIPSDPISHLTPKAIGEVLSQIADIPEDQWDISEKIATLQNQLSEILFKNVNPRSHCLKKLSERESAVVTHSSCNAANKVKQEEVIIQLHQSLESILGPLSKDFDKTQKGNYQKVKGSICSHLPKGYGEQDDFGAIAKTLISALKESRLPGALYPRHFPEQALLAFFIKKSAHGKEDLMSLFEGMQSKLAHDGQIALADQAARTRFKEAKFGADDYHGTDWRENPDPIAEKFAREPSLTVFAVQHEKLDKKELPPLISYGTAKHGETTYPDCGETSVRNFFNILVFDDGKFNSNILTKLKDGVNQGEIFNPLREFYEHHTDPSQAASQEARDAWSQVVGGHHERGVNYLKGGNPRVCEIGAGVDNMMKVIENLLFHGVKDNPLSTATDRATQLDALCAALSPARKLRWKVVGASSDTDSRARINSRNNDITIQFSTSNNPLFEWKFDPSHFAIQSLNKDANSWLDHVAEKLVRHLQNPAQQPLLFPFVNKMTVDYLTAHGSADILLYSLPLSDNNDRLFAFEKIVSSPREQAIKMKSFAHQLRSKLPEEEDLYTRRQIHSALADAGYPFGDPPHALGKPSIIYKRVTTSDLNEDWSEALRATDPSKFKGAWKSPSTFSNPKGLIWMAPPIQDQKEMTLPFSGALKYCENLGIPHARLPYLDEVEQLFKDFGAQGKSDNGYVPQYLPRLKEFWASNLGEPSYTNGRNARIIPEGISSHVNLPFRCVINLSPLPLPVALEAHDPKLKGLEKLVALGPIFDAVGLIWSSPAPTPMTLDEAKEYCETHGGHLPTAEQFHGLEKTLFENEESHPDLWRAMQTGHSFWTSEGKSTDPTYQGTRGHRVRCIAGKPNADQKPMF